MPPLAFPSLMTAGGCSSAGGNDVPGAGSSGGRLLQLSGHDTGPHQRRPGCKRRRPEEVTIHLAGYRALGLLFIGLMLPSPQVCGIPGAEQPRPACLQRRHAEETRDLPLRPASRGSAPATAQACDRDDCLGRIRCLARSPRASLPPSRASLPALSSPRGMSDLLSFLQPPPPFLSSLPMFVVRHPLAVDPNLPCGHACVCCRLVLHNGAISLPGALLVALASWLHVCLCCALCRLLHPPSFSSFSTVTFQHTPCLLTMHGKLNAHAEPSPLPEGRR